MLGKGPNSHEGSVSSSASRAMWPSSGAAARPRVFRDTTLHPPSELGSSPVTAAGGWGQDRTWECLQGLESKGHIGMLAVVIWGAMA